MSTRMVGTTDAPFLKGAPVLPVLLPLASAAALVGSLTVGGFEITLAQCFSAFLDPASAGTAGRILWDVRMPRVLEAFLAGGSLAAAGAALQGVFRNPLVDPHIIGVTSGAAFGGALAILLGASIPFMMMGAFGFGMLALGIVCAAAFLCGSAERLAVVLAGILTAGVFSALVSLLQIGRAHV